MSEITIYHNPRCSKSRQTLQLLEDRGIEPEIVHYLDTPPSVERLDALCTMTGREPLELMRVKEARFKELGLSKKDTRSRADWLQVMHDNPILIKRPIVARGDNAAVGRPPEAVLDIL
jgi:arsenate reductase